MDLIDTKAKNKEMKNKEMKKRPKYLFPLLEKYMESTCS